jgi:hypothetical protein
VGETLAAHSAFLGVDARRIKRQAVFFRYLTIDDKGFFRALRDAKAALETFLRIYLVSHFSLQIFVNLKPVRG